MNGPAVPDALKRATVWVVASALAFLAAPGAAVAGTDSTKRPVSKASSFAPHRTTRRAFGTPIKAPILHKRHRQSKPPSSSAAVPAAGKETTVPRPAGHDQAPK